MRTRDAAIPVLCAVFLADFGLFVGIGLGERETRDQHKRACAVLADTPAERQLCKRVGLELEDE